MTILTQDFVIDALESERRGVEFPIDFDDVWQELGYSTKGNAERRLKATHAESLDYTLIIKDKRVEGNHGGGSTRFKEIKLTIDTFKSFCMVSETEEGRKVRQYFIEIEKAYRAGLELQFLQPSQPSQPSQLDLIAQIDNEWNEYYLMMMEQREKELTELMEIKLSKTIAEIDNEWNDYHLKMMEQREIELKELYELYSITTDQQSEEERQKPVISVVKLCSDLGYYSIGKLYDYVIQYFQQDVDYVIVNKPFTQFLVNEKVKNSLLCAIRSSRGVDSSILPEKIVIDTDHFFFAQAHGKNKLFPKIR